MRAAAFTRLSGAVGMGRHIPADARKSVGMCVQVLSYARKTVVM